MGQKIYLFTGAGNNFVVLDGRGADMSAYRDVPRIQALCREYRTDGLMILDDAPTGHSAPDFKMEFYNPDGSGGMMCGNGGRCIVAFADLLGLHPASPDGTWHFLAPDGMHEARILDQVQGTEVDQVQQEGVDQVHGVCTRTTRRAQCLDQVQGTEVDQVQQEEVDQVQGVCTRKTWTVRLKMIDVQGITPMKGGFFLNTGTRHFVRFVEDVNAIDMEREARPLRWDPAFAPEGTNVNFVQVAPDGLHVRTFEKGVEGETLACGTGLTASAIAAFFAGIPGAAGQNNYHLQCRRGDWLQVAFNNQGDRYSDVYLTGPAELVNYFTAPFLSKE